MTTMRLFNPMALFNYRDTPMSSRRARREARRQRFATTAITSGPNDPSSQDLINRVIRNYEEQMQTERSRIDRQMFSNIVVDEASTLTAQQLNEMYDMLTRGTNIRRRSNGGHQGGYDLVHKE